MTAESTHDKHFSFITLLNSYDHMYTLLTLSDTGGRMSHSAAAYSATQQGPWRTWGQAPSVFGVLLQKEACHGWERWEGGWCCGEVGERERRKPQETAALVSLPGESCVKDIGVTLSTQAQSWGISLASLTRRHSSVLPEWTTLTPIWQEVRAWLCLLF